LELTNVVHKRSTGQNFRNLLENQGSTLVWKNPFHGSYTSPTHEFVVGAYPHELLRQ